MRISDILRQKGTEVVTAPPDATVRELIASLAEHRIGAVVVIADGKVAGIVSERDVVRHLHERGDALLETEIGEIMTTDVVTCAPDGDVDDIAETMTERRIRHMPVLADGRLAGLVSIGDVVKSRIRQLEQHRGQLEQYITG
jgi:CBS domain-containing protein